MNLKFVARMKHDIDKLLVVGFIQHVKEATWFSLIIMVPNNNETFQICVDFCKLNVTTKKKSYLLLFTRCSTM